MLKPIKFITNYKYLITIVLFALWMLFFDANSILFMNSQSNELEDLKMQEDFLKEEIVEMKRQKLELFSDLDKLERFAREKYFFKKDNEDVYVIEE